MNKPLWTLDSIVSHSIRAGILVALTAVPTAAWAQTQPPAHEGDRDVNQNPDATKSDQVPNDGDLPPARSDTDPHPEVATPGAPAEGVIEQAGTGGATGYGRSGVLELGGSMGFQLATNLKQYNVSPTIGWFLADNFQLSAILDLTHVGTDNDSATIVGILAEPSYHLPFTRTAFAFFGLGMGASYVTDLGTGFAMAPRLGANFMVGRSGILTPSMSYQYTTHDTVDMQNTTLVAVSSALRVNVGYTVMW